jgi:seryl-tRNA synthetase
MLALQYIRENKEDVLEGLKKRGFKNLKIINQIINLDSERRTKQAELDKHLAESNQMAKEIGNLFKAGEIKKENVLK